MGTWALEPWDNDAAADWYGIFMEETGLRDAWLRGIGKNPAESPDVVRAAGALFVMLGRVYVWPMKHFDHDLALAIAALSQVATCDEYEDVPELRERVAKEIAELETRRTPAAAKPELPPTQQAGA